MKNGRLQLKDIPERPILEFLRDFHRITDLPAYTTATWYQGLGLAHTIPFPPGTPWRLIVSKMARLIDRKLVDGCGCGCRGDFRITPKGVEYLEKII